MMQSMNSSLPLQLLYKVEKEMAEISYYYRLHSNWLIKNYKRKNNVDMSTVYLYMLSFAVDHSLSLESCKNNNDILLWSHNVQLKEKNVKFWFITQMIN